MNSLDKTQVTRDLETNSILVSREFDGPLELIWKTFTESELLDQWWGPAPWKSETKFINFSVGGYWLYSLVGPKNERHWGKMSYLSIDANKSFHFEDAFCDENGNGNAELPLSKGSVFFTATIAGTLVEFRMTYGTEEQLLKIIELGFERGITTCMAQLNRLIQNLKSI